MAKRIKEISTEDADRICKDIQLCWRNDADDWKKDFSPTVYREDKTIRMPGEFHNIEYGIEIDDDKPEYTPNG